MILAPILCFRVKQKSEIFFWYGLEPLYKAFLLKSLQPQSCFFKRIKIQAQ